MLFASFADHAAAIPVPPTRDSEGQSALSEHDVSAVGLDVILAETGPVRLLKLDVEGAEYPILLTSRGLALVAEIIGEYHEFTEEQMARMAPSARVGNESYGARLLRRRLEEAGFRGSTAAAVGR